MGAFCWEAGCCHLLGAFFNGGFMAFITTAVTAGAVAGAALAPGAITAGTAATLAPGIIGGALIGAGAGLVAKNQMKKGEKTSTPQAIEAPKIEDIESEQRREVQRKLGQRTRTVLTSPLGAVEGPTLENKTLLGE